MDTPEHVGVNLGAGRADRRGRHRLRLRQRDPQPAALLPQLGQGQGVALAVGREHQPEDELEYLRSFGLFGLWQLWQSSGPGGRVHFMIAEKSSDVKVQRVSRLTESKARCCISHDFGGFYQIIPCIRPAVVRIKGAHGCPATIRIFVLGRAVQTWQREPGGRPMPPAMEAIGARSTIRERGSRGQSLSP